MPTVHETQYGDFRIDVVEGVGVGLLGGGGGGCVCVCVCVWGGGGGGGHNPTLFTKCYNIACTHFNVQNTATIM